MTDAEFERIYTHIKSRYGIDLSRKREIIVGRLDNYLRLNGYASYTDFMDAVQEDYTGMLEKKLVDFLTTNHTFFMREFEHFDYLKEVILPELKIKEAASRDIRIWCGASSTGEEPYMLAMLLSDFFGFEAKRWETTLLATDISTEVLLKAKKGIYTADQIASLPDTWKRRYMHQLVGTDTYEVAKEIKERILFRQFNLMDPFPFKKPLHVIMLRNVMIYFDQKTKNDLVQRVYEALEPGGYLFVGKTETVDREEIPFEMVEPSIFRKK